MSNDIAKTQQERQAQSGAPRFRQPSDIIEREDGFHIFMDMPGVAKGDLVIDLEDSELVVSGRACAELPEGEKYLEVEFGSCEYRRAFKLSDTVDRERIRASLSNGVLELFLPKAEAAQPRRIEIKAG
ncbi:Hsp20/alpha crystallin family protein [Desulfocurvus sp.]|jgi:HSP20 family molecular chaperone IbpA|uniref:Hsp20/alpha crystallin family protein n=1 Tax=Desulfocurvus sp. TaxID=2871698 RepID=UPI0025BF473D|nr:Hsp20/alpha crystallin family protein [Desulfocurvus sp.]MCK9239612.1 Hsp20/alpha crystallin family protein [Desulfocurvus sp.]